MHKHFLYILKSNHRTLYTPYPKHLNPPLINHNNPNPAKYTKITPPLHLLYQQTYTTKSQPFKPQYQIKTYTTQQNLKMIQHA
ncbi:GIY-YIG nuclease family protein [Staphylococcus epidermidis]|uniref:GIY-YIG nuclease family protein n=1 Tax=Staphylococcus epidermidis TaxID=1282 RepID=UPI00119D6296|nr:GIY-YIG nuclease family protein [Staphylococcus epidermidis]